MTDILERLRTSAKDWKLEAELSGSEWVYTFDKLSAELEEAADEIERLRADNEQLRTQRKRQRAALARIMAPRYHDAWDALEDAKDIVRAALKETKDG